MTRFYYDGDPLRFAARAGSQRVKQVESKGGTTITTAYAGAIEVTITPTQRITQAYYLAGAQRVATRVITSTGSVVYYLHADHLGSASLTTDASGNKLGELRYSPYGVTRYVWGNTPTDRRFTGQRSEEASLGSLYDYGARMYSVLGRFLSADSIVPSPGNPQSLNRYSYTLGNPLAYVDPDGHNPIPLMLGIAAFAGFVWLSVEGSKMVYGELTVQTSGVIEDAARHPSQGVPFDPISLRAAINIQEAGMLYDDLPGNNSTGLGAVRTDVAEQRNLGKYTQSQLQNDHVLNVKLRAALMAQELAKCVGCSKTDQYIVLALAQNDTFVAESFLAKGWDEILLKDDADAKAGPPLANLKDWGRDKWNKATGQGWFYGRMRFELREFVAQLRKLQSQGAKLPEGVNLDYIECLGNSGNGCSR